MKRKKFKEEKRRKDMLTGYNPTAVPPTEVRSNVFCMFSISSSKHPVPLIPTVSPLIVPDTPTLCTTVLEEYVLKSRPSTYWWM